jgi:hypothetical protein
MSAEALTLAWKTLEDRTMRHMVARTLGVLSLLSLLACLVLPTLAKTPKTFAKSDDAKEEDEPQAFLSDYDKLVQGKEADWAYFPAGSLKALKKVTIKEFASNGVGEHKLDAKHAAEYGKDYMEKWMSKQGFTVAETDSELTIEGNVFNAWEPSTGARVWGGWMANPGCGIEIVAKDSGGKIVGEIRHKARGSTVKDCIENGLESIAEEIAKVK